MNPPQHSLPVPPLPPSNQPADEPNPPYWQPSTGETVKLLGWRWLLVLPAVGVIALTVVGLLVGNPFLAFNTFGFGVISLVVILPAVVLGHAARTAVSMRKDPFCVHCGYELTNLPDHYRCPECGRPYTFAQINEYRHNPWWYIERRKRASQGPATQVPLASPAPPPPSQEQ